ncbi:hypothetical protein UZ717_00290 [Lactiplantibacillus plantarum]|nr:Hypothetical protein zj316_1624 [Lactiplantibacillus plantarum ZJ316]MDY8143743.1 hypothetical protein [Lactiplantibacillus plantarum]
MNHYLRWSFICRSSASDMYLVLLLHAMFSLTQPWQSTVDDQKLTK